METIPSSFFAPRLPSDHISTVWEHLQRAYKEEGEEISPDIEISISVFLFGGQEIQVSSFGYAGPNLLIVNGKIGKEESTAYIHQSCLQVVFSRVSKDEKNRRQPVGFRSPEPEPGEPELPATQEE